MSAPIVSVSTAATGNDGESVISGGGALTGTYSQTTSSTVIDSESQLNAAYAVTADVAHTTQAIGNDQGFGATASTLNTTVNQANGATVIDQRWRGASERRQG